MPNTLPKDPSIFMQWDWVQLGPFADNLVKRPLSTATLAAWMEDWSDLNRIISEIYTRLYIATTRDTADQQAQTRFNTFMAATYTSFQAANQVLKQKLLASGLQPAGFEIPLHNLQTEAEIYREENLPLLSAEKMLINEYDAIIGAETVEWEGLEVTTTQLQPVLQSLERAKREKAWRLSMERRLMDREKLNALWTKNLNLHEQIARNAGFADYRSYRWKQLFRFDYTPENCFQFHDAIEKVVIPADRRLLERRKQQLGYSSLRPWDLNVDPLGREALRPYQSAEELETKVARIFHRVDPELGEYFEVLRHQGLLDLENRKGKAPGAYCNSLDVVRLPFIFGNAVGLHADVSTLVHEAGHAFHVFEQAHLPYFHQLQVGMEFAEVASMAMELLASPYLLASEGGFYSKKDAARALIEHLEEDILFWPYMAVVDAFQHWAYTHVALASETDNCDQKWAELWQRFMPVVDWSGLEDIMETGWQRKPHIFEDPFYYVEYGLASLGAFQVWRNALQDHKTAVAAYRRALALGGTVAIPQLYAVAGARFAMDEPILIEVIQEIENQMEKLEAL
jgi:oligoendopeptidase F